jgi:hypothetical protein
VALPHTLGPPTGSIPMTEPQVRNSCVCVRVCVCRGAAGREGEETPSAVRIQVR